MTGLNPFRERGAEITRLETLSDAVFAFAITLLVVSLEVPGTFNALLDAMRGFLAFAVCFTFLLWIWHQHTSFFRRYRLEDSATVALNGVLLFVVLFYVYPLKFLWTLLLGGLSGGPMTVSHNGGTEPVILVEQTPTLMIIYALGFVAVFLSLALLYLRAWQEREALGLSETEVLDARMYFWENVGVASVGVVSMAISGLGGPRFGFLAGMSYMLVGVVKTGHGYLHGHLRGKLEARVEQQKAAQPPAGPAPAPHIEETRLGLPQPTTAAPHIEETRVGTPQPPRRKLDDTA